MTEKSGGEAVLYGHFEFFMNRKGMIGRPEIYLSVLFVGIGAVAAYSFFSSKETVVEPTATATATADRDSEPRPSAGPKENEALRTAVPSEGAAPEPANSEAEKALAVRSPPANGRPADEPRPGSPGSGARLPEASSPTPLAPSAESPATPPTSEPSPVPEPSAPAPSPAAIATRSENETLDDDFANRLFIGLGAYTFRIDAQDPANGARSNVISSISPQLELGWKIDWDARTHLVFSGELTRYRARPLDNSQSFVADSGNRTAMSIAGNRDVLPRLSLGLKACMGESLFLRGVNTTTLAMDKVSIYALGVRAGYDLLRGRHGNFGVTGGYDHLFPATGNSYDIQAGSALEAGVFFRHESRDRKHALEIALNYREQSQNTFLVDQKEKTILYRIQYEWGLAW